MTILLGLLGLVLLVAGADLLVRGASQLAVSFGIRPLVVGLTVVAFGTSAPELAVSVGTSLDGEGALALGNALGSNVFNILAILGAAAIIAPQAVESKLIRTDVPLMIGAAGLVWLVCLGGEVAVWEGGLLFALLIGYTVWTVVAARKDPTTVPAEEVVSTDPEGWFTRRSVQLGAIALGMVGLVFGADLLVEAAVSIARDFGVSEVVIGLTIVAAGTSLPELATTIVAAFNGAREIAVGNVVGSNLFNALGVVGVAGLVGGPVEVPAQLLAVDLPVMMAASVAVLPIVYTDSKVSRIEGAALVAGLVVYWGWLLA